MIGPHTGKAINPCFQRQMARENGWTAIQTNYGQTQSLELPIDMRHEYVEMDLRPVWTWHAAYVASVNPGETSYTGCACYLRQVIKDAAKFQISSIVIHTGKVSGVPIERVMEGMNKFIEKELLPTMERYRVRIAVEIGASTCGFNLNPKVFAKQWRGSAWVGYCVDLAHVYACGCTWKALHEAFTEKLPFLCHANFPGSGFGSSHDIHGWRRHPHLMQVKKMREVRTDHMIEHAVKGYDETIISLHTAGVPLIVEGSGFRESNVLEEIEMLREIIGEM